MRVNAYLGRKPSLPSEVIEVVFAMKHQVDAGITKGWPIRSLAKVLDATESVADLLEQAIISREG